MTSASKRRSFILLGILCLIIGTIIGILIGYFTAPRSKSQPVTEDESISEKLMAAMDPEQIRENLRWESSGHEFASFLFSRVDKQRNEPGMIFFIRGFIWDLEMTSSISYL